MNLTETKQILLKGFNSLDIDNNLKEEAIKNIINWLTEPIYAKYKEQILYLINNQQWTRLLDSFYKNLTFGTGGKRGKMGIGPNRINEYTIQITAQGHCDFIYKNLDPTKEKAIVIAYDARAYTENQIFNTKKDNRLQKLSSRNLALAIAQVCVANDIDYYMFSDIRSTPELSFAVRYLNVQAGIIITASHNPKDDNGYKAYLADGGLLLPPLDQELSDIVNNTTTIKKENIDITISKNKMNKELEKEIDNAYIEELTKLQIKNLSTETKQNLKIVYSPLHGVGSTSALQALRQANFNVIIEENTAKPDPNFSSIPNNIANPEKKEVMTTLLNLGKKIQADLLIATDPDADRMGLMVLDKNHNYVFLNGNEIGSILTEYVLSALKEKNLLPDNPIIAKTIVTTELLTEIANHYKTKIISDLPVGFKYIADVIRKLEHKGETDRFVLGAEESHGFLIKTYTRDKDGASATILIAELAAFLKQQNQNLIQYLNNIYLKYGYYHNSAISILFEGAQGTAKRENIMKELRNNPPSTIANLKVSRIRDLWAEKTPITDTDKASRNILIFELENKENLKMNKLVIRPSGTEPKIKIYLETGCTVKSLSELNEQQISLHKNNNNILEFIKEKLLNMGKN